jgi:hypothetical protein
MYDSTISFCKFSEDFNRPGVYSISADDTYWIPEGEWRIGGATEWGENQQNRKAVGYTVNTAIKTRSPYYYGNMTYHFLAKPRGGGAFFYFNGQTALSYYAVVSFDTYFNDCQLARMSGGNYTMLLSKDFDFSSAEWKDVKINLYDKNISVSINGISMGSVSDSSMPWSSGYLGFGQFVGGQYSDFRCCYAIRQSTEFRDHLRFSLRDYNYRSDARYSIIKIPKSKEERLQLGGVRPRIITIEGYLSDNTTVGAQESPVYTAERFFQEVKDKRHLLCVQTSEFTASGYVLNINGPIGMAGTNYDKSIFNIDMIESTGPQSEAV